MKMLLEILLTQLVGTVCALNSNMQDNYGYERMHHFGLGHRIVPNFRQFLADSYQYPQPLPSSTPSSIEAMRTPYHTLYQGNRRRDDTRVYNKKFSYEPAIGGHHVVCRGSLTCKITHLAVETKNGIPIIFRGGVGYDHFVVIVKARAGDELEGRIRAYCMKSDAERFQ